MALPKAVKKQASEAVRLQTALNQSPEDTGPAQVQTPEEQAAAQKAAEEARQKAVEQQTAEAGTAQPGLTAPEISEELTPDQATDWEKRFKGMKQLYDRELPKLRGQLDESLQRNDWLAAQLEDLQNQLRSQQAQQNTPAPVPKIEISDEEIEQYGEGYIELVSKISAQSNADLAKQIMALQNTVASLQENQKQVIETVKVTTDRDFWSQLERVVQDATGKNWRDINKDPEFHVFLAETVPYTQHERQHYLNEARDNLDVNRAAQFFIDFAGTVTPKKPSTDTGASNEGPDAVPDEIVMPASTGAGAPLAGEKEVYTSAYINQFYQDKRRGKYKGREKEARDIEKDILAAGREGRIVDDKPRFASA